jgi:hypothetical protein
LILSGLFSPYFSTIQEVSDSKILGSDTAGCISAQGKIEVEVNFQKEALSTIPVEHDQVGKPCRCPRTFG